MLKRAKAYFCSPEFHDLRKWDLLVASFYGFLLFFLPTSTFDWDSYVRWADQMREVGLANIYQYWAVNYMPFNVFAVYLWQAYCAWRNLPLNQWFHLIKVYPMIFDALTVMLIFRFAKRWKASLLTVALLFLPNLAFQYNSFIWGQFDTVYTFFLILSLFFVLKKQPLAAFFAFFCAVNSKIQAAIFLPAVASFAWLYIYQGKKQGIWDAVKTLGLGLVGALVVQNVLFAPFTSTPPWQIMTFIIQRSASLSTWITFNADNFWMLIGVPSMQLSDITTWVAGQTYHTWGIWLFFASTALTFVPSLFSFATEFRFFHELVQRMGKEVRPVKEWAASQVIQWMALVCYLQTMSFFYFMTQMHERYSHPAVAFAGLFAVFSRRKLIFALTCLAYFINLERVDQYWGSTLGLGQISWIGRFSAALFLIALVLAFRALYGLYLGNIQQKRGS